jgi:hypothetical protein
LREPRSLHLSVLVQGRTLNPRGGKSQWQVTLARAYAETVFSKLSLNNSSPAIVIERALAF